jgi:hypothetical protein
MKEKKQVTHLLGILLMLFLASCSKFTNTSITKRHYRPGYYIAGTNELKHAIRPAVNPRSLWTGNKEQKDVVAAENAVSSEKTALAPDQGEHENPKTEPRKKVRKSAVPLSNEDYYTLPVKGKELGKTRNPYEIRNAKPLVRDDDALSLIWILIVIILIVWLIGFLLDVGNLIHILLIVALILLILWLLRII